MSIRITPLTDPAHTYSSRRLAWLAAHPDGTPAGSAFLRLFTWPGETHRADLELTVHPAERRRGVGTLLLAAAVGAARYDGRRNVFALVEAGSPGEPFLRARDFRRVLTLMYARLALAQVDPEGLARIVARPHPGYRLASWDGVVPDELAVTFAASRRAMDDMPMEDADYGTQTWDVDRVRAAARAVGDRGDLLHTVVAIDESNGSIAGFTELVVRGDGKGDAQHYGTGVLPEHRGHGLGLWMKAESIRQAGERHPALDGLLTDTADGNRSMRAINDGLGYEPTHREYGYQLDI
ncbi:GNAT family N-acetyltransferase [Actinoallomurus sp. NPDC052308]|uniref:GNAT family N-acetyltransferase n=1 Tax=Actinoallomurus sp. NPDC052308 TaxID=3155530 RepID=UPI00341CBC61